MFFGLRSRRKLQVSKILITGGAGFLGASLIQHLLNETKHQIISIERPTRQSKFQNNSRVKVVYHDLQTPLEACSAKEMEGIEYIVHFASLTNVATSIEKPESFVINNVLGTTHLLEFARKNITHLKQFLYFSTAEIFGRQPAGAVVDELGAIEAYSPYAATKIGAQEMCLSYKNAFNMPVVIAYAMNTFGPHQSQDKFIPLIIGKILRGEKVYIYLNAAGTAPNRRNYLHVDDLCDAILFLNRNGITGEKYNIAAEEESDNLKIAQMISRLLGKKLDYELIEQKQNSLTLPRLSGEKLQRLGWHQKKTLEEGLRKLIELPREKSHDSF